MVCIFCDNKTTVTNSRPSKKHASVWRRRHCTVCQAIFTTNEAVEWSTALKIQNSAGTLSDFQRSKLYASIYEALRHTKNADINADALTNTVISKLLQSHSPIWHTSAIRNACAKVLQAFDETSAGVYRALYR